METNARDRRVVTSCNWCRKFPTPRVRCRPIGRCTPAQSSGLPATTWDAVIPTQPIAIQDDRIHERSYLPSFPSFPLVSSLSCISESTHSNTNQLATQYESFYNTKITNVTPAQSNDDYLDKRAPAFTSTLELALMRCILNSTLNVQHRESRCYVERSYRTPTSHP